VLKIVRSRCALDIAKLAEMRFRSIHFNIMTIICAFESMYQSTVMKMITIEDKIGFAFEKMY
jgi:hypothetical protein